MIKKLIFCCGLLFILNKSQSQNSGRGSLSEPARLNIPFRDGKLWGYCDTTGKVLLQPKYEETGFYTGWALTVAPFRWKGKYGIIDGQFNEVIPAKYDRIDIPGCCTTLHLAAAQKEGKFGVINVDNTFVIQPTYDTISFEFLNMGYILAGEKGMFSLFNNVGKKITDTQFSRYASSRDYWEKLPGARIVGEKDGTTYFIKDDGTVSAMKNPQTYGTALISKAQYDAMHQGKMLPEDKKRLMSIEDSLKRTLGISRILYDRVAGFLNLEGKYDYVLVEKDKKIGLLYIDSGRIGSKFYDDIHDIQTFPVALDEDMSSAPSFSQLLMVRNGSKYGIVNEKGKEIYPFIYDGFGATNTNYFVTKQGKKSGAITLFSTYPPIPCKYDTITSERALPVNSTWSFLIYKVQKNGKYGFVGENGVEFFTEK